MKKVIKFINNVNWVNAGITVFIAITAVLISNGCSIVAYSFYPTTLFEHICITCLIFVFTITILSGFIAVIFNVIDDVAFKTVQNRKIDNLMAMSFENAINIYELKNKKVNKTKKTNKNNKDKDDKETKVSKS